MLANASSVDFNTGLMLEQKSSFLHGSLGSVWVLGLRSRYTVNGSYVATYYSTY